MKFRHVPTVLLYEISMYRLSLYLFDYFKAVTYHIFEIDMPEIHHRLGRHRRFCFRYCLMIRRLRVCLVTIVA